MYLNTPRAKSVGVTGGRERRSLLEELGGTSEHAGVLFLGLFVLGVGLSTESKVMTHILSALGEKALRAAKDLPSIFNGSQVVIANGEPGPRLVAGEHSNDGTYPTNRTGVLIVARGPYGTQESPDIRDLRSKYESLTAEIKNLRRSLSPGRVPLFWNFVAHLELLRTGEVDLTWLREAKNLYDLAVDEQRWTTEPAVEAFLEKIGSFSAGTPGESCARYPNPCGTMRPCCDGKQCYLGVCQ